MKDFEIVYVDHTSRQIRTVYSHCANEKEAKIIAHAMKPPGFVSIEVWAGYCLIYERPSRREDRAPTQYCTGGGGANA